MRHHGRRVTGPSERRPRRIEHFRELGEFGGQTRFLEQMGPVFLVVNQFEEPSCRLDYRLDRREFEHRRRDQERPADRIDLGLEPPVQILPPVVETIEHPVEQMVHGQARPGVLDHLGELRHTRRPRIGQVPLEPIMGEELLQIALPIRSAQTGGEYGFRRGSAEFEYRAWQRGVGGLEVLVAQRDDQMTSVRVEGGLDLGERLRQLAAELTVVADVEHQERGRLQIVHAPMQVFRRFDEDALDAQPMLPREFQRPVGDRGRQSGPRFRAEHQDVPVE